MVLLGQERRGDQHRHLLAVLDRLERGPERHLGLAEADITHHEPVHRGGRLHVVLHVDDGAELVRRLLERETVLELPLPRGVDAERVTRRRDPLLVEHHEFLGDLLDGRTDPGLGGVPVGAAHLRQRGGLTSAVEPDRLDLVRRDVEPVAAPVLEQQVVAVAAVDGPGHHPAEPGDTVLVVHDERALVQVVEELLGIATPAPGPPMGPAPPGEVGLGQHRELERRQHRAPFHGSHHEMTAGNGEIGPRAGRRQFQTVHRQQVAEPIGGRHGVRRHDHPVPVGQQLADLGDGGSDVAHDRLEPGGRERRGAGTVGHARDRPDRRVGPGQQAVEGNVQTVDVVGGDVPGPGQRRREVGLLGQDVRRPIPDPTGFEHHDQPVGRQQVGQDHVVVDQPGQPRLHAVEELTVDDPVPLLTPPRLLHEQPFRVGDGSRSGPQLAARMDLHLRDRDGGPLVGHRELRQPVDLVTPQVDADRHIGGAGEHVDDGAPHRDLPAVLHLVLPSVPEGDQLLDQFDGIDHIAAADHDRVDHRLGVEPLGQGPHGSDHDGGRGRRIA